MLASDVEVQAQSEDASLFAQPVHLPAGSRNQCHWQRTDAVTTVIIGNLFISTSLSTPSAAECQRAGPQEPDTRMPAADADHPRRCSSMCFSASHCLVGSWTCFSRFPFTEAIVMKKMILAVCAAATIATAGAVTAAPPMTTPTSSVLVAPPVINHTPVRAPGIHMQPRAHVQPHGYVQPRPVVRGTRGAGFFSNLMELERRKNAWLRRTFFGR